MYDYDTTCGPDMFRTCGPVTSCLTCFSILLGNVFGVVAVSPVENLRQQGDSLTKGGSFSWQDIIFFTSMYWIKHPKSLLASALVAKQWNLTIWHIYISISKLPWHAKSVVIITTYLLSTVLVLPPTCTTQINTDRHRCRSRRCHCRCWHHRWCRCRGSGNLCFGRRLEGREVSAFGWWQWWLDSINWTSSLLSSLLDSDFSFCRSCKEFTKKGGDGNPI